jgi:hypothetical protein
MPYQFRGQHRNEEVVLLCRKHPFVMLRHFLVSVLLLLVPFVVNIFVDVGLVLSLSVVICFVASALYGVLTWYSWYNSVLLLTTERVVVLEQHSIVNREFMECGLTSIMQVSHEVKGLLETMWGFGSISVFTGGAQKPLVIADMPEPYEIQQEIQRAMVGEVDEEGLTD